ncbi:hypothetical protein M426DRAFT_256516 [Hypoxylon sp. CI-4A]|nr:hypothetical protein M426DRAFT_256516 [Hypoxylon sp. CI-4A]
MTVIGIVRAPVLWHANRDVKILILLRMIRLFGYGGTTFVLALYLHALGFEDSHVGLFMTLTLLGDLMISLALTYVGDGLGVRLTVVVGALLMCASGVAFALLHDYWFLLLASVFGVINPSANEIDPFKAIEESATARLSTAETRSDVFAWWTMLGMLGTAASNLLTGFLVDHLQHAGVGELDTLRAVFIGYAIIGLVKATCCMLLSSEVELSPMGRVDSDQYLPKTNPDARKPQETEPLLQNHDEETDEIGPGPKTSRKPKPGKSIFTSDSIGFLWRLSLALVFDFIGSGLAQISWMTYFFKRDYDISEGALGLATFLAGLISSILNLASSPLSRAIGQVQTMVVCHTINSISLLMVSVSANKYLALAIFIFRIVTREIDNAPRQAFISSRVLAEERTSAMGVVNIIKIIGSCVGLYCTGIFAGMDQFWLAFIVAGGLKLVYNVLISAFFWRGCKKQEHESPRESDRESDNDSS